MALPIFLHLFVQRSFAGHLFANVMGIMWEWYLLAELFCLRGRKGAPCHLLERDSSASSALGSLQLKVKLKYDKFKYDKQSPFNVLLIELQG